jgi:ATP-binding cassette, subfamily B, bacterial HlyB/CyaB
MSTEVAGAEEPIGPDGGLRALCSVGAFFRIAADPHVLARDLALGGRTAEPDDLVRAAKLIGLRARIVERVSAKRLASIPTPALIRDKAGLFLVYLGSKTEGLFRVVDIGTRTMRDLALTDLHAEIEPFAILIGRRFAGAGTDPEAFTLRWFLPSLVRYKVPISNVLLASLFVQLFALVTPLFFQVIIDKVLTYRSESTLQVLTIGLVAIGIFDVTLQYLRIYALAHTSNRIDVELGSRLFHHLMRLPLTFFESRATGQIVARMRELETIRAFLTGQGLFSAIDLVFTVIFIGVLLLYSARLTLIVLVSIPAYVLIAMLIRPALRRRIKEKFRRNADAQQFLVETVVGATTVKAAAVEPVMQALWEEKLAAYVRTSFDATKLAALGQNGIQFVSRVSTAGVLFFGASLVIDGELTVGALIAFNMIASQAVQPILRLSQLWQDFQQIQVSVEQLGDILNRPQERYQDGHAPMPRPKGAITIRDVTFRYRVGSPEVLKNISLDIAAGEVIGIVGPSGSGKSTVAKLLQKFYELDQGSIVLDGTDFRQVNTGWLRTNIGVVLQENTLFNRTVHDNIAFADPGTPRPRVMQAAGLAGAAEFISRLPHGYDTMLEERGANLSGGQRQRLAIARALVTNPPILIFDEATSALDYESERVIQANMRAIARNRTVIVIAHRLATVRHCNRIVVMDDGRIVDLGTHDELLARPQGLYARLWSLQSA